MKLRVELERETDGRWIGEVPSLPGVLAYGKTRKLALAAVEALALRVIADRIEHGELAPLRAGVLFEAA
jgi:predicted RNase H-like HicB family nuclease